MKGFGAQGVALLLLAASTQTFSAESTATETAKLAPDAAEVTELQEALQASKAEAEFIRTRNRKLEQRRQSLEQRITELREQILQQEQSTPPVADTVPAVSGPPDDEGEQTASDGEKGAAPEAQK